MTPSEVILRKNLVTSGLSSGESKKFGGSGNAGQNDVVYWLVHKARTRHDPNAMPTHRVQADAATSAVRAAVRRILAR